MMLRFFFIIIGLVFSSELLFSQNIAINKTGANPHSSALLDVNDTASGILIPRLTYSQMNSISSPAVGLLVFLTDSLGLYFYDGNYWSPISNSTFVPFTTSNSIIHSNSLNNYSFIVGPDSLNHSGGPNGRLAFYNYEGAFRTGYVTSNQWHTDSIGLYSFGAGYDVKATGEFSAVFGDSTSSSGVANLVSGAGANVTGNYNLVSGIFNSVNSNTSTVGGQYNSADFSHSHGIFGSSNDVLASNPGSFVAGISNTVSFGQAATIFGQLNETNNHYAFAGGVLNTVDGYCSTAFGREINAVGAYSIGAGYQNTINGSTSAVFGSNNTANSTNNFAAGIDNLVDSNGAAVFGSLSRVECFECFAAGRTNTVTDSLNAGAGKAFALGDNNSVFNYSAGALGTNNTVMGNSSLALGDSNTINNGSWTSLALGAFNTVMGASSIAAGSTNSIIGNYATALGYSQTITNDYAFAAGNTNTVAGWGSAAFGYSNTVNSGAGTSFTAGFNNTFNSSASSSALFGVNNINNNSHEFGAGSYNINNAEESITLGHNLTSYSKAEVVVGMFNSVYTPNSLTAHNGFDRIFAIGNGTSVTSRSNAVTVLKSGFVGIGTDYPSHILHIDGVGRSTSSTWATSSDKRAKTNIQTIQNASEILVKFNPVTFNWNDEYRSNHNVTNATNYGFISQEVELVVPEMVSNVSEAIGSTQINDFKLLDKDPLLALLVKAFQEQQLEIEKLRNEINTLRALVPTNSQTAEK